jgi:hypothetical protein
MTHTAPARFLRSAGWALPILAVLCCAPSVARAGCGDYVVTKAPHAALAGHQPDMPAPGSPHKPCHGPNCSGVPVVPQPFSAPTVTPTGSSEWCWLTPALAPLPPHAGVCLAEHSSPDPTHLASGIFHPPRAA